MNSANLLLLAERLDRLPKNYEHFDMQVYTSADLDPSKVTRKVIHNCGTVACAVGHGPTIRGLEAKSTDLDWEDYCLRVFGIDFHSAAFDFMFGPDWSDLDNTPHGAAKRIRYYVANGIPSPEDFYNPEVYANA